MSNNQLSLLHPSFKIKRCSFCGNEKPLAEFNRDSKNKDGIGCRCKSCDKERLNNWKKLNPAYMEEWRRLNYSYFKEWRRLNPGYSTIASRRWRENNPEKRKVLRCNYRARKNNSDGTHTAEDIKLLFVLQKKKCAVCRVSITKNHHVDHVIPLALGGSNKKDNLQLLCPSCNRKKHAKHPVEFMQSIGMLL